MKDHYMLTDAQTDIQSPREVAPDAPAARHRARLRVLLVEDNEDHVMLARRALQKRGHAVTAVLGGQAAMLALAKGAYDVVALDYQLPDTTGLEALLRIKKRNCALPVVMVTASGSEQVAVEALKNGASDYVVKTPGYERELVRALELSVEKARADTTEQALRAELERRARTDSLTGLLNRGEMERLLKREIQRRLPRYPAFAFVLADVDGFKAINDEYGHSVGDAVLCHIGRVLRHSTRSSDFVARWGGDEFAVLLPGAGLSAAKAFAKRLSRLMSDHPPACRGQRLPAVGLSAGVACVTRAVPDLAQVLKWADRALYAAKTGGRNQTRFLVLGESEEADVVANDLMALAHPEGDRSGDED
jgi:diguanylate cyclase (GGDEF)-like protein